MNPTLAGFRTTLMTQWRSGLDVASMLALADAATQDAGGDAVSFVLDEWFDQALGAQLPESTAEFACHGAVLQLKNGYCGENPVERVFTAVAATNPDVPPRFLETGTGRLPQEFQAVRFDGLSISANDVTGVISIDFTVENGQTVRFAVEFLERILRDTDFPRELNIQVTGLTGDYVPMPELPKIGMSQLFMAAVSYPPVRVSVVRYAREAMKYDFFYDCPELSYETGKNIQLGGVAVFALGLTDLGETDVVGEYMASSGLWEQSMELYFLRSFVHIHGGTLAAVRLVDQCLQQAELARCNSSVVAELRAWRLTVDKHRDDSTVRYITRR